MDLSIIFDIHKNSSVKLIPHTIFSHTIDIINNIIKAKRR